MPQVAPGVAKARAAMLRERAAALRAAWLDSLVGTRQSILVERPGDRGHAGNFAEVRITPPPFALSLSKGFSSSLATAGMDGPSTSSGQTEVGTIVTLTITGVEDGRLTGAVA